MLHSELTRRLMGLLGASPMPLNQRIEDIILATRWGVNREGGSLNATLLEPSEAGVRDAEPMNQAATAPEPKPVEPGFNTGLKWGPKSLKELQGVKHELVLCATTALMRFSKEDFMCYDGIRTEDEQKHYVAIGTSQTMNSMHLPQPDGFGHAVDLVPCPNGVPIWDWSLIYFVAKAMWQAANALGMLNHIRWGGAWDKTLADFTEMSDFHRVSLEYTKRHPGKDFLDGPHFEWKE